MALTGSMAGISTWISLVSQGHQDEDGGMGTKRHKPEDVVAKLRQADVLIAHGQSVADMIRAGV